MSAQSSGDSPRWTLASLRTSQRLLAALHGPMKYMFKPPEMWHGSYRPPRNAVVGAGCLLKQPTESVIPPPGLAWIRSTATLLCFACCRTRHNRGFELKAAAICPAKPPPSAPVQPGFPSRVIYSRCTPGSRCSRAFGRHQGHLLHCCFRRQRYVRSSRLANCELRCKTL